MKLFKSLLLAPAALGLLTPMAVSASEINFKAISNYSEENPEIDINSFKTLPQKDTLLSGGEGLVDSVSHDGGFSETTTASFSLDTVIGAVDGGNDATEALSFDYQMNIGLSTSFTGEDALDVTIDIGGTDGSVTEASSIMGFQATTDALVVDGITYTFPVGGATVVIGDTTDISATFTGACAYSAFTDYISNCGTDNSVGANGKGVTATVGYTFDSGFSLAGGISSKEDEILTKEGTDLYAIEAAYTADNYGVAVAYASDDMGTASEVTYWGINAYYVPESTNLPSVSVGVETEETGGTDSSGYFIGLTWPEVGPGSVSLGLGTQDNYTDAQDEFLTYEASYSYAINDGMTITPGAYIREANAATGDDTGILVKTSFSF